jgi:hypothetical protein
VDIPKGKTMDGNDLTAWMKEEQEVNNQAFINYGIRTRQFKCLFDSPPSLMLNDTLPELSELDGILFDLNQDPEETQDLFHTKPDIVSDLFHQFRKKMSYPYKRSLSAQSKKQPHFPFSIPPESLETNLEIIQIPHLENTEQLLNSETKSGWLKEYAWEQPVFALPDAQPLNVKFRIPNGKYLFSTDINGSCIIEVNGVRKPISSDPLNKNMRWEIDHVNFGIIEIKDETFQARIIPQFEKPWFGFRLLSFEPVIKDKIMTMEEKKRAERLKALGYIK